MTDTRTAWQKDADELLAQQDLLEAQEVQHVEPATPPQPSEKWQQWQRLDPENKDHLEVAFLHPDRVFESEKMGKLLVFRMAQEADAIIDNYFMKRARLPQAVTALGAPPPDDLNLPVPTIEDALIKKLVTVLDMSKQSLQTAEPRAVIAATMESLRKLQTLDGKFPQPLTRKSWWGILGDFVDIAYPTTVACREMLLYEMLPLIGVILGDSYYLPYGSDKHFPSIFSLAIGRTSDGKGQAWHACQDAMELVEPAWLQQNVHSNPASGEGLIRMLGGNLKIEGSHKKRVAIFNTEMVTSFVSQGRKDSSLGGFLRKAYDGDHLENYRSEGKKSTTADNYILGFCGTITPKELASCMPMMDWSNGAQNRFLWSIGFKDKNLGRSTQRPNFISWALRVQKLVALNQSVQPTPIAYAKSGQDAWDIWFESLPEHDDTILADSQARIAANCARVANIYAQLDERRLEGWKIQLEARHVEAAIEFVNRSRQSVEWYLAQQMGSTAKVSYEDIQRLKSAMVKKIRDGGEPELTATEISALVSHKTIEQRDEICTAAGFRIDSKKSLR